jgi:hypothetical protein
MRRTLLLALAICAIASAAEHTVNDLQFLAGHWIGSQGVDQVEEIWSNPASGSLIGMYREMREGKTTFYEFLSIEQEASGPIMRMKHFKANLIGLEEKDESVIFDLQSLTGGVALFVSRNKQKPVSLSYQRTGPSELLGVLVHERDGKKLRNEFHYRLTP